MKTSKLAEDSRVRSDLFQWNGRMDDASLGSWLGSHGWLGRPPADLVAFWRDTGGGDAFETETILGPLGDPDAGDDIAAVNREMRARGMPPRFLVFHIGFMTTAVDTESGDYVELVQPSFRIARRFASLEDWYLQTLRAEYAQRYGLR